jgi:NAD(P)-dependent dehydrogenase (short-subunit alcohol dehydrogenase family)
VRLAEEGADVIAIDICAQIPSNPYPLAGPEDLAETGKLVEKTGRRAVLVEADVRSRDQLQSAVKDGLNALGQLDIVVANAGILPMAMGDPQITDFIDAVDVDFVGVVNTIAATVEHLEAYASIVVTGSTAGLMPGTTGNPTMGPGGVGYGWSKRTLVSYTETLAVQLAPKFIRVNCVHPTNCNTDLLQNQGMYDVFRPDLSSPTREDAETAFVHFQAMPIPYIEPIDVSNLVLFLASDESRYLTGQQIRVDAGSLLKSPGGPAGR